MLSLCLHGCWLGDSYDMILHGREGITECSWYGCGRYNEVRPLGWSENNSNSSLWHAEFDSASKYHWAQFITLPVANRLGGGYCGLVNYTRREVTPPLRGLRCLASTGMSAEKFDREPGQIER